MALSPVLMTPCYKEMLWGGGTLNKLYGKNSPFEYTGESWEAAFHENGKTIAASGEFRGLGLGEIIARMGQDFLGSVPPADGGFPVLFKLIDARDRLSLQVHPDDETAALDNDRGKTEMWLVLEAAPGAGLYLGFETPISKDEYRQRISENSLHEVLHFAEARAGDVFFLPHGMVHAIGEGLVIAEIQQSSDATYRVYDWGRLGLDGNPRPLHIDKALRSSNLSIRGDAAVSFRAESAEGCREFLPGCRFFAAMGLEPKSEMRETTGGRSFHILFVREGECEIIFDGGRMSLCKGQTCIIPAALREYSVSGNAKLYRFFAPDYDKDFRSPLDAAGNKDMADTLFHNV